LIGLSFLFSQISDLSFDIDAEEGELDSEDEVVVKWGPQSYVIDVQGFQYRSSPFIPKEVTVVSCETGEVVFHRLVSPPIPYSLLGGDFRAQIKWTTRKLHGLLWDEEGTPYSSLGTDLAIFLLDAHDVIVKGCMKKDFISQLLPTVNVINAEDYTCPSLREIVSRYGSDAQPCNAHIRGFGDHYCSMLTAQSLYMWMEENVVNIEAA
jgi:hypothetical protein